MTPCSCVRRKFNLLNIKSIPDDVKGIYGLWYEKWCIYVGKGKDQDIQARLIQHWKKSHNEYLRAYIESEPSKIEFCYTIAARHTIDSLEMSTIDFLQPVTNKVGKEK